MTLSFFSSIFYDFQNLTNGNPAFYDSFHFLDGITVATYSDDTTPYFVSKT